jgi:nucleotide-binding universal stress UspA family protein
MKKQEIRNVLVPVDFSKMSIQAIDTAKRLAHRFGATVHLAHVHHWQYPLDFMGPVLTAGKSPVSFEEHRRETLAEDLKTLARKFDLPATAIHLIEGASAFHEICRLAEEIPADLIVMPTHGHTGLRHVFLGGTAERVVQHSPCPVFVSREDAETLEGRYVSPINTILVPVDFSSCSRDGLNYAVSFAERTGAKVIVFHAVYPGYMYANNGLALYDVSGLEKAASDNAERQMREFVSSVEFDGVKFETAIVPGPPAPEICSFAEQQNVDMIVTSTHGWTGFKHVLMGSIAEQTVRHAPCSVLVVPSHPKTRVANLAEQAGAGRSRSKAPRALNRLKQVSRR